jgi:hypothetical protein
MQFSDPDHRIRNPMVAYVEDLRSAINSIAPNSETRPA